MARGRATRAGDRAPLARIDQFDQCGYSRAAPPALDSHPKRHPESAHDRPSRGKRCRRLARSAELRRHRQDRPRDPATTPPPATLEEARNQPGRREQIEEITRRIESRGDQVRLLPAGLDHRPRDGQGRRRLVLPAGRRARLPARLRRHRQPVHRPRRQLHRLRPRGVRAGRDGRPRHLRPACRGTRAWRACTATATTPRPASCSTPTRARTSSASWREFERGAGLQLPDRHRARDDVAATLARTASSARGRRRSPTATTSTSSRSCVRCCSTWSSTGRRSAST